MTEKNYYSLRFLGTNAFLQKGCVLKTTNPVLHIGETADCEVRYEASDYEPEVYASIVANADGEGWRIIRRSPHVKVGIAGVGDFGYVWPLHEGDVISFGGQTVELEFHVHHDANYGRAGVVIEEHRSGQRLAYGLGVALAAVLMLLSAVLLHFRSQDIRYQELRRYESSVCLVRVDSVQWIETVGTDTLLVRPTKMMDEGSTVGTAFLTTDGRLLTARHCIEYWIGWQIDPQERLWEAQDDDIRKWALLAETYNQDHEGSDTTQQLRVFFSLYAAQRPDSLMFSCSSTDDCVHINRSHDGLLPIGDFQNTYYWRTVRPYHADTEAELGDIACIDVPQKGTIELADSATIGRLNQSVPVAIMGFPKKSGGRELTFEAGSIKENRADTVRTSYDIQFEANITHGFSGGPVFARVGNGLRVVGVVSKIDTDNGIYKKAVPVTEILRKDRDGKEDKR